MTRAYSELYLSDAKKTLGAMFDYAVNDCGYDIDFFASLFLGSGCAKQFETGNAAYISGMSGVELARKVIEYAYPGEKTAADTQPSNKSPEYWAGWALADYQWYSAYRFSDIFDRIRMSGLVKMYTVYHEMDIRQFYDTVDNLMKAPAGETKLRKTREAKGLSQSELANLSGVNLRSIQMYEQRNNDIDKAQGQTLYKLSAVLGCNIEDLLEKPSK